MLAWPSSCRELLLDRIFPPAMTSLPKTVTSFTQKNSGIQSLMVGLEEGGLAVFTYSQKGSFSIEKLDIGFEPHDIREVCTHRRALKENLFLASSMDSVYLLSLGVDGLRTIRRLPCPGRVKFVDGLSAGETAAFGGRRLYRIDLSPDRPDVREPELVYETHGRGIISVVTVHSFRRHLIFTEGLCVAVGSEGDVAWSEEIDFGAGAPSDFTARDEDSPGGRIPGQAREIWAGYSAAVGAREIDGRLVVVYGAGERISVAEATKHSFQPVGSVAAPGRVIGIHMGESSFLATGGAHGPLHWSGFLNEYSYDGSLLKHIPLSYPGVFIDKIDDGYIVQAFQNQLLFFSDRLRLLAADHSPLYPVFLTHLRLDEDESEDIVVGGLSGEVSLPREQVEGIVSAVGMQPAFEGLSLRGDRYRGFGYRVDCYLNGAVGIRLSARRMLDTARLLEVEKGREQEVERAILAAKEGFHGIDDLEGVARCDKEMAALGRLVFDRRWFVHLLFIGCVVGGFTGMVFTRKTVFVIGVIVIIIFVVVLFEILGSRHAQTAALVSALCLFIAAFVRLRLKRRMEAVTVPGPSADRYQSFTMALGAFEHSGRATQILESLNLLLLSYPRDEGDVPEFRERLIGRSNRFIELVMPQVREIGELLGGVIPKGALSIKLDNIAFEIERGLRELRGAVRPGRELLDGVLSDIDYLDDFIRTLRHFVGDHPGSPILTAIDDIYGMKKEQLRDRDIQLEIVDRLRLSSIAAMGRHELDAVLENLFSNVIEALAGAADRRIRIELDERDGYIVMEFSDSGPGIEPERKEGIFDRKIDIEKGGFGLPYTKFVLDKADGSIGLGRSRLGGATFVLRFRPWHLVMRAFLLETAPESSKGIRHGS